MNAHLRTWLAKTPFDERERVAVVAGTSVGHLWQLAGGHRRASPALAERLEVASAGELSVAALRPDLFQFAKRLLSHASTSFDVGKHPTIKRNISDLSDSKQSDSSSVVMSSIS